MSNKQESKFFDVFTGIYDKRQQGKVRHKLIEVLFIIVTGILCKMNDLEEINEWATLEENQKWLKKYIQLENGIPSRSTMWRILNVIDPKQFSKCFINWAEQLTTYSKDKKPTVAIDGKAMRGSKTGEHKWTHIVSAWCSENNLVLGQTKVEEKSNEITAIPELLDMLYLKGCVVTIDAMGCQKEIVKKIKKKGSEYVISLKGNQGTLHDEAREYFEYQKSQKIKKEEEKKITVKEEKEKGHGRIEERRYTWSTDIGWMKDARKEWIGLKGIGKIETKVEEKGEIRTETRHYIGSVNNAEEFGKAAREHWGIESMHWNLDVTFKDDANTTRKDVAPENMAVAKRIALNMLRKDKEKYPKKSTNSKRIHAFGNNEYRDYILQLNFEEM